MSNEPSGLQKIVADIRARWATLAAWIAAILAICAIVMVSHANSEKALARLASPSQSVRDGEVLTLADRGHLTDLLASTQDPTTESTSPQNVVSARYFTDAADSINRLIDSHRISNSAAFDSLFFLYKNTQAKPAATLGLAKLGSKGVGNVAVLVQHLSDGDPDFRQAAIDALSYAKVPKLATPQTAAAVIQVVKDPLAQVGAEAALTAIGKPSVPYLVPYINDSDMAFREQVIGILGQIGDASAVPSLIQKANALPIDPPVRRVALTSLAQIVLTTMPAPAGPGAAPTIQPPAAMVALARSSEPILIAALKNPQDDSLARAEAALALGRLGDAPAMDALVGVLGDLDSLVRQQAESGIQSVGPSAVPVVAGALHSANPIVRAAAAAALGNIGGGAALEAIRPALADRDYQVRLAAASSLHDPAAIPLLVGQLSDSDGFVASAASSSLGLIGKSAAPALIACLTSGNATAPFYASHALTAMGRSVVPQLLGVAEEGSAQQTIWCAVILGQIQDPEAKPVLGKLAQSADPSTRWAAEQALAQFGAA